MISLAFTPPVTKPASHTLEKLTRKKKNKKKIRSGSKSRYTHPFDMCTHPGKNSERDFTEITFKKY